MNALPAPRGELLDKAAGALGLALSPSENAALLSYIDLLARWNATYNLTAVRDPSQMLVQHVFDCLSVIPPLRRAHLPTGARVLDVGSGAGLPGIIIALLEPTLRVTCVDTVGKKAAFIRQVATALNLRNLQAEHARVEALRMPAFDLITARAFSSLADLVRLTRSHLTDGIWMAMKGKEPQAEIADLPADIDVFHVEQLHVPELNAERCLVWMRPLISAPRPGATA